MKCVTCGAEVQDASRFCPQCGAPLPDSNSQAYDSYAQSGSTYDPYAQAGTGDTYTATATEASPAQEPLKETDEPTVFGKLAQIFGYLSFFVGPAPAIVMACIGFSKYKHPANRAKCKRGLIWGIVGGATMFVLSYLFGFLLGILMYG